MDDPILQSWEENAYRWTDLIRSGKLDSRKITNPAILNTILSSKPTKVLDLGCGEGWLTRALLEKGTDAYGVDGIPGLISESSKPGNERFSVRTYSEVENDPSFIRSIGFDAVVFNFSLYEKEIHGLFTTISSALGSNGLIFIQTLHPTGLNLSSDGHWMDNAWEGLPAQFTKPHRWYARSLESWKKVLLDSGFKLEDIIEPGDETPVSLILIGRVK